MNVLADVYILIGRSVDTNRCECLSRAINGTYQALPVLDQELKELDYMKHDCNMDYYFLNYKMCLFILFVLFLFYFYLNIRLGKTGWKLVKLKLFIKLCNSCY